jgi:hypothetical protein
MRPSRPNTSDAQIQNWHTRQQLASLRLPHDDDFYAFVCALLEVTNVKQPEKEDL